MPGVSIGSVSISVTPNAENFTSRLRSAVLPGCDALGAEAGRRIADGINAALRDIRVNATVDLDTSAARAALDELGSKSVSPTVGLDDTRIVAALEEITVHLDELTTGVHDIRMTLEDGDIGTRLDEIALKLDVVTRDRTVKINADTSQFDAAMQKFAGKSFLQPSGMGAAFALTPALIPLLVGAAGGVAGLGLSFAGAAVGAAAFGKMAESVITNAGQDATKLATLQQKLAADTTDKQRQATEQQIAALEDGWSGGYASVVTSMIGIQQQWKTVTDSIVTPVLPAWFDAAGKAMTQLKTLVKPVADVFKSWGQDIDRYFSSHAGSEELHRMAAELGRFSAGQLRDIGGFVVDIARGVVNLGRDLAADGVNFGSFGDHLKTWGDAFLNWSKSAAARADVQKLLDWVKSNGRSAGDLLGSAGKALALFAPGLTALGQLELRAVGDFLNLVAKLPPSLAKPLVEVAGAVLLLSKLGVVKVGVKVVGAAARLFTGSEIAVSSAGMQAAGDTMVGAAAGMQRAADTMAGASLIPGAGGAGRDAEAVAGAGGIRGLLQKIPVLGGLFARGVAPAAAILPAAAGAGAALGTNALVSTALPRGSQTPTQAAWTKVGAGAAGGAAAGAALGLAGGPLAPLTVPAGALIGGIGGAVTGALSDPKAIFKSVEDAAQTTLKNISGWAKTAWAEVGAWTKTAWDAIGTAVITPVTHAFDTIKSAITGGFDQWWKTHGDAVKQVWHELWSGISAVFHSFWDPLSSGVKTGFQVIETVFRVGFQVVEAVFRAGMAVVKGIIQVGMDILKPLVSAGFQAIVIIAKVAWAVIKAAIKIAWDLIVGIISVALDVVTGHWRTAWNDILNTGKQIWNAILGALRGIWNAISGSVKATLNAITSSVSGAWNTISGATRNAWHAIASFFTQIWNTIYNSFSGAVGKVSSFLSGSWNKMISTAKGIWNGLVSWITGTLAGAFRNAFQAIVNGITGVWNKLGSVAKVPVNFIINTIYDHGIVPVVNAVGGLIGLHLNPIPGLAAGGKVTQGTTATADDVLARISKGETVVSAAHSQQLAPIFAAVGVPGYAAGGQPAPAQGLPGGGRFGPIPGVGGVLSDIGSAVAGLAGDALVAVVKPALEKLVNAMPGGGTVLGADLKRIPVRMVDALIARLKSSGVDGAVGAGSGADVAKYAASFATGKGHPYVWGGSSPSGWDCSGATAFWLEHFGYFPEKPGTRHGTSESQFADPLLQSSGAVPGALAFFRGGGGPPPGHVGLVLNPKAYVSALDTAVGTVIGPISGALGFRIPKGGFQTVSKATGSLPANWRAIATYLTAHGFTHAEAAGIAGNIKIESNGDPNVWQKGGGGGYGLIQWTPPPKGLVGSGLTGELAQIVREGKSFFSGAGLTNPASAAYQYLVGRERPANPGATAAAREASANAVFKAMGYDRGGWLPPGLSLTHNATGRPEPILSGTQWDMLAQAAHGGDGVSLGGRAMAKRLDRMIHLLEQAPGRTGGAFAEGINGSARNAVTRAYFRTR